MIDITIPYWGDPRLMREAVDSVLAQTSSRWRLTVIDDAYPDPSVGEYLATLDDPRIRYIRKAVNEGLVANFRSCVAAAQAPYMVMLGSDDRLLPTYVDDILTSAARHPQAQIIQPGVRVIDAHGQVTHPLADRVKQRLLRPRITTDVLLGGEDLAASLLHGDWLYWPSLAFRTDAIASVDFRDEYRIILDLDLVLSLLEKGAQLLLTPPVCFEYRRHEASESSASLLDGQRFTGEKEFFGEAARRMDALGWHRAARAARLHVTSRLHALTLLPTALRTDRTAVPRLVRHAVS